jgi:hypothetical protein
MRSRMERDGKRIDSDQGGDSRWWQSDEVLLKDVVYYFGGMMSLERIIKEDH